MLTSLKTLNVLPAALLVAAPMAACVSTASGVGEAVKGCPEFQVGATIDTNVKVDARVRAFMQASADLGEVAATARTAVKTACLGIANDLGAQDTWTALGDTEEAITNVNGTGACDAARSRIVSIMNANANANFALVVSRGACHEDFSAEARCEANCSAQPTCDPGTVETRCDPAQLSVVCQGSCSAQSFCEGRTDVEADCDGQCEAECTGSCSGTCTDESGHSSTGNANCHGKCTDHCSGKCNGRCKIEKAEGFQCGASIACKGGCTGSFTNPTCETEFTPPKCTLDKSCFESCRANVVAKAVCDPPTVKLLADATVGSDVSKLVASVEKNLPPLIQTAEANARQGVDIVQNVSASGQAVLSASGNLDGKSIACAGAAANSLTDTGTSLTTSTQASAQVATDCSSHAR